MKIGTLRPKIQHFLDQHGLYHQTAAGPTPSSEKRNAPPWYAFARRQLGAAGTVIISIRLTI